MKKTIYDLDLNEVLHLERHGNTNSGCYVRRVPGGWIFTEWETNKGENEVSTGLTSVFVPWNTEFSDNHDEHGQPLGNREKY